MQLFGLSWRRRNTVVALVSNINNDSAKPIPEAVNYSLSRRIGRPGWNLSKCSKTSIKNSVAPDLKDTRPSVIHGVVLLPWLTLFSSLTGSFIFMTDVNTWWQQKTQRSALKFLIVILKKATTKLSGRILHHAARKGAKTHNKDINRAQLKKVSDWSNNQP